MPGIDHGAHVQAPVDEQLGAGAAARVVGHEECDRRGDLAGLRRSLQRQPPVAARNAPPRTPALRDDWRALRDMSDGTEIPVRWYDPAHDRGVGPAVVYLHGGGLIAGSVPGYAADSGVPFLSVDYRIAPEHPHPTPVEDCFAAVSWLLEHANEQASGRVHERTEM